MNNYPPDSRKIIFKPLTGPAVKYRIWVKDNSYYWYAKGNSGREKSLEAAMRAAREWIGLGLAGIKSQVEHHGVFHVGRG